MGVELPGKLKVAVDQFLCVRAQAAYHSSLNALARNRNSCSPIRVLDPTGIVFLTHDYEWNLVEKIVFCGGEPAWDRHALLPNALWTATLRRARVYATYHPQSRQMQGGLAEKIIAAIADDQM